MKEIFIIYNKKTGFLEGGAGRIDREWDAKHADGSTMSERISKILVTDSARKVIYLPNQNLPDTEQHKIKNGKIVLKTKRDKLLTKVEVNEEKIQNEIRKIAIDSLITKEELPINYKE